MAKFEVIATDTFTSVHIADKYTLEGALSLACDLLDKWEDVAIREREEGADVFKVVAKLSNRGLIL
jgi:hypothetical protein